MTAASTAGRKARRAGSDAEVLVLRAAERYAALGVAWLWRCGRRGRFQKRGDVGTPVDFVGYRAGGRCLLVEVKSTSAKRLSLHPHGKPLITESEHAALTAAMNAGAQTFVIVRTASGWWRVRCGAWCEAWHRLSADDLDSIGTPLPVVDGLPMFLHHLGE